MKTIYYIVVSVFVLTAFFTAGGCAGKSDADRSYTREGVDLGYITKVAVLPFTNNTKDELAARRVRDITSTQILTMKIFDVVDKGIVDSAMREIGLDRDTPLDVPLINRLGQRLGVQGFIIGEVNSIGESQQGTFAYAQASLSLQLMDAESAQILWKNSDSLNGYSVVDRLFGLEPMDTFQVTVTLIQSMLATIPK